MARYCVVFTTPLDRCSLGVALQMQEAHGLRSIRGSWNLRLSREAELEGVDSFAHGVAGYHMELGQGFTYTTEAENSQLALDLEVSWLRRIEHDLRLNAPRGRTIPCRAISLRRWHSYVGQRTLPGCTGCANPAEALGARRFGHARSTAERRSRGLGSHARKRRGHRSARRRSARTDQARRRGDWLVTVLASAASILLGRRCCRIPLMSPDNESRTPPIPAGDPCVVPFGSLTLAGHQHPATRGMRPQHTSTAAPSGSCSTPFNVIRRCELGPTRRPCQP